MSADKITLKLTDAIGDCPTKGTSMSLPIAAITRLDALAEEARHIKASRNELLAALIADADIDREALESLIGAYRQKLIGDVLPGAKPVDGDSVVVPMRKPGRPSAAGAAS